MGNPRLREGRMGNPRLLGGGEPPASLLQELFDYGHQIIWELLLNVVRGQEELQDVDLVFGKQGGDLHILWSERKIDGGEDTPPYRLTCKGRLA
jgi:hypothetical protein